MKKSQMSPKLLRGFLGTAIVILILLSSVGFYFAQNWLQTLAVSVSHKVADSTSSGTNEQALAKLKGDLAALQDIATNVNSMFASSQTFQTQAVKDLGIYAGSAGITISQFGFSDAAIPTAGSTAPATTITVTLASPVSYIGLIKFMKLVEGNLPKMQISSINLSRIEGDSKSVKIDQLIVAVYTH